jgi:hypothetical protein
VWLFIFSFPPQTFFPLSSVQSIIHDSEWLFVLFILTSTFLYFFVLHSQPANCDDEGMTLCEQLS